MYKVSVLEFALLAADTYRAASHYEKIRDSWQVSDSHKAPRLVFENDLFARTYVHRTANKIDAAVVAYRGTMKGYYGNYINRRGPTVVGNVTWLDIKAGLANAKASYDHASFGQDLIALLHPESFAHNAEIGISEQHTITSVIAYLKNHPVIGREAFA